MARRYTDSDKWKKPWFSNLSSKSKLLWLYILDECDACGVWYENLKVASLLIGETVTEKNLVELDNRIVCVGDKKWLIPDYITFQQKALSHECKAHKPIFDLIEKHNFTLSENKKSVLISINKKESIGYKDGFHNPTGNSNSNSNVIVIQDTKEKLSSNKKKDALDHDDIDRLESFFSEEYLDLKRKEFDETFVSREIESLKGHLHNKLLKQKVSRRGLTNQLNTWLTSFNKWEKYQKAKESFMTTDDQFDKAMLEWANSEVLND